MIGKHHVDPIAIHSDAMEEIHAQGSGVAHFNVVPVQLTWPAQTMPVPSQLKSTV